MMDVLSPEPEAANRKGNQMTTQIRWTLVQHTGYSVGGKEAFKQAVEERQISLKQAGNIAKIGGLIYHTYSEARDNAEKFNFDKARGIIPQAEGTFILSKIFDEPIFIPAAS